DVPAEHQDPGGCGLGLAAQAPGRGRGGTQRRHTRRSLRAAPRPRASALRAGGPRRGVRGPAQHRPGGARSGDRRADAGWSRQGEDPRRHPVGSGLPPEGSRCARAQRIRTRRPDRPDHRRDTPQAERPSARVAGGVRAPGGRGSASAREELPREGQIDAWLGVGVRRLRDVGEHAWIARLLRDLNGHRRRGRIVVGPGDDAALVRPGRRALLLTTDALIENGHFRAGWASPAALGRRAFRVSVSDLAAMGGTPAFALLSLEAPPRLAVRSLDALVRGFATAARASGATLVGGNVAASSHLAITVALVGEAPARVVTRAGGRAGDALYLTGT